MFNVLKELREHLTLSNVNLLSKEELVQLIQSLCDRIDCLLEKWEDQAKLKTPSTLALSFPDAQMMKLVYPSLTPSTPPPSDTSKNIADVTKMKESVEEAVVHKSSERKVDLSKRHSWFVSPQPADSSMPKVLTLAHETPSSETPPFVSHDHSPEKCRIADQGLSPDLNDSSSSSSYESFAGFPTSHFPCIYPDSHYAGGENAVDDKKKGDGRPSEGPSTPLPPKVTSLASSGNPTFPRTHVPTVSPEELPTVKEPPLVPTLSSALKDSVGFVTKMRSVGIISSNSTPAYGSSSRTLQKQERKRKASVMFTQEPLSQMDDNSSSSSFDEEIAESCPDNPPSSSFFLGNPKLQFHGNSELSRGALGSNMVDAQEGTQSLEMDLEETKRLVKRKNTLTGAKFINGYSIIKSIGRGSTSKVKLGYDNSTNRLVAIKQVRRSRSKSHIGGPSTSQQLFQSFLREVGILKMLRHRNIVSVYEVIDDPNASVVCLVMQYVDNGPIRKLAIVPGSDMVCEPIPPHELLGYAKQMLSGLVYLHKKSVVHRDIKPDNILISSEKKVFLADFGVAETFDEEYRKVLRKLMVQSIRAGETQADNDDGGPLVRGFRGTLLFQSPELWNGSTACGNLVDIWAMGVTLYILLTGKLPFKKIDAIVNPALPRIPTEYGPEWTEILQGMLNRDTEKRLSAFDALSIVSMHLNEQRRASLNPNADPFSRNLNKFPLPSYASTQPVDSQNLQKTQEGEAAPILGKKVSFSIDEGEKNSFFPSYALRSSRRTTNPLMKSDIPRSRLPFVPKIVNTSSKPLEATKIVKEEDTDEF